MIGVVRPVSRPVLVTREGDRAHTTESAISGNGSPTAYRADDWTD